MMIVVLNDHMQDMIIHLLLFFLYEYISIWTKKFTFLGWMFVPSNQHHRVNKYHTISCGDTITMQRRIQQGGGGRWGSTEFQRGLGTSTMQLMQNMTKQLLGTGMKFITDSGFYVQNVLIVIFDTCVYGSELVKKCRYWPTLIYGDGINFIFFKGGHNCLSGN